MQVTDDKVICVQREWDGWKTAEVRLRDLLDIHWRQPTRAPRALVHGYISCTDIIAGEIPHGCEHTGVSHRLLVCVLKRHSAPSAYAELARRADQQRMSSTNPRTVTSSGDSQHTAARGARV
jgi:hypothetical protein